MTLRKIFHRSSGFVAAVLTTFVGILLVLTAWSGVVDPEDIPLAGVMVMALPLLTPLAIVIFIADALFWRRSALIMGIAMALAMPVIVDVFPVGTGAFVSTTKAEANTQQIKLLSYNCAGFSDLTECYEGDINPTVKIILDTDADIVALQECYPLVEIGAAHLSQADIDSLHLRYPYVIEDRERRLALLSKHPAQPLHLGLRYEGAQEDEIAACVVDINGCPLTIFNVHLRSIGLTPDDKQLYEDVTELDDKGSGSRAMLGRVRRDLVSKLASAASSRSRQVKSLIDDIGRFAGDNTIVCGDFNDVPGSYAMHSLSRIGFRDAYAAVGRGYMSTYNSNRLWVHIDHVMWRGNLRPISQERIVSYTSDHYPLITRFDHFTNPTPTQRGQHKLAKATK